MKGDKKIIGILNELLAGELTAVDQYLIHGEMYADFGLKTLAEKACMNRSMKDCMHAPLFSAFSFWRENRKWISAIHLRSAKVLLRC